MLGTLVKMHCLSFLQNNIYIYIHITYIHIIHIYIYIFQCFIFLQRFFTCSVGFSRFLHPPQRGFVELSRQRWVVPVVWGTWRWATLPSTKSPPCCGRRTIQGGNRRRDFSSRTIQILMGKSVGKYLGQLFPAVFWMLLIGHGGLNGKNTIGI